MNFEKPPLSPQQTPDLSDSDPESTTPSKKSKSGVSPLHPGKLDDNGDYDDAGDDDDDIYIMMKCMSVCMSVTFLLILLGKLFWQVGKLFWKVGKLFWQGR